MNSPLDEVIARAKKLAREHDGAGAMLLANELISRLPQEMKAWLLRGYLNELDNNWIEACANLTRAIELNSLEPHLFYTRGRYQFQTGNREAALADFSEGLRLCDFYKNDYYREELYFWRAETLIRLGRRREALEDLSRVGDEFTSWTDKLRTKHDLLEDCTF